MVSYSSPSKSESTSMPSFAAGSGFTKKMARQLAGQFKPIVMEGDMSSPIAKILQQLGMGEAVKAGMSQTKELEETPGLAGPAKYNLLNQIGETKMRSAAGIPVEVWKQALAFLESLLKPTGQMSQSSSSDGGGFSVSVNPASFSSPKKA